MKSRIIEELAQAELMLPNRVARALGANERAKLRMSVLQAAMQHARDPEAQISDFVAECGSTGLDAVTTRALVALTISRAPSWCRPWCSAIGPRRVRV